MGRTRLIGLLVAAGLASACAGPRPAVPSVPVEAALERATAAGRVALGESLRAGLQGPGTFGTGPPAVPVLVPPDVRRVWVPTHENAEGELIAGHWVFLRVRDFRWFLEPPASPGAPSPGPAGSGPASGRRGPGSGVPWVEGTPGGASGASRTGVPGAATLPVPSSTPWAPPSTGPGR